jgi:hypothetical protein
VLTVTSGSDAVLYLFQRVSDLIAEYLLVPPRVHAQVPTPRTASYGHHVACRLLGVNVTLPAFSSSPGIVGSSTDVPDNGPESHTAARPFPGPRKAP